MDSLIYPNWPQSKTVMACSTTRIGGDSLSPYVSFSLGLTCWRSTAITEIKSQ
ncbi:MAG: hypothetical protein ACTS73_04860 [Arsenophonus sp. NEOnobi-MAG3]